MWLNLLVDDLLVQQNQKIETKKKEKRKQKLLLLRRSKCGDINLKKKKKGKSLHGFKSTYLAKKSLHPKKRKKKKEKKQKNWAVPKHLVLMSKKRVSLLCTSLFCLSVLSPPPSLPATFGKPNPSRTRT
jgi:hypothetical protein